MCGSPPTTSPPLVDFVGELPSHLAQQVLARLDDHRDFAAAGSTCRKWRQVLQEEAVWQSGYHRRFPAWGREQPMDAASQQATEQLSWHQRYRWRLGLDRNWSKGRRHLVHALDNHHAWVNAVRLVPGTGILSGGSEGAVNFWSLDGELEHHDTTHSQAVWALDADRQQAVTGAMDGYLNVLDLQCGEVSHRLPVGWRGPAGQAPDEASWDLFEVVTSVQLLPGGASVLAGCMDGSLQLLDLRCRDPAAQQLQWQQGQQAQQQRGDLGDASEGSAHPGLYWWRQGASSRLCAARCHEHLMVAAGEGPAVSLHDLRMSGARFAELALPAGGQRPPSVFAMDLLYPRLATAGDWGQVQLWDLSKLHAAPGALPAVPANTVPHTPRVMYSLWGAGSSSFGSSAVDGNLSRVANGGPASMPAPQEGQQQVAATAPSWPSPRDPPALGPPAHELQQAASSSPAACSIDCLIATNDYHLQQGMRLGCVYGVKLLEDWRVLTADHAGYVRLWNSRELVGAQTPCLTVRPAFAPSIDDPALGVVNPEGGPIRPVGMHCVDACLTHLVVAGRDSVVRVYSYE